MNPSEALRAEVATTSAVTAIKRIKKVFTGWRGGSVISVLLTGYLLTATLLKLGMEPAVREAISGTISGTRIDLLVCVDDRATTLRLADTTSQALNQLL